ncbi:hypothetical protein EYF80_025128 [Liparis tanakae]|uniref:Uncharacterized protein n=1 Tax=Liparis tanakae TaxID=230148 RepID=A0A4Z2HFJ7_9TELE|nr:hypothetical protein EYF80_025128 [Liparis tanakae]
MRKHPKLSSIRDPQSLTPLRNDVAVARFRRHALVSRRPRCKYSGAAEYIKSTKRQVQIKGCDGMRSRGVRGAAGKPSAPQRATRG